MPLSVSALVLRARQLEIEALRHLADRVTLADVMGQLIHALQHERGVSSVYLASGGQRFATERQAAVAEAEPMATALQALFADDAHATARTLSLMAWVQLDLDALPALREQIAQRRPTAHEAVAAYSRIIAGLLELLFHVADAASVPAVSRQLVALVHLVQGKEAAGQERAVGAQLFASGAHDDAEQQRIVHLIEAQERSLGVFETFADATLCTRWRAHQLTPEVAQLERLRRTLCTARPGATLDTALSERWFEVSSARMHEMGQLQSALVRSLRQACAEQEAELTRALEDSETLLQHLRDHPPPHAHAVARFFQTDAGLHAAPVMTEGKPGHTDAPPMAAVVALMEAQSARLASMEVELDAARRALHERKVIERAKGALMTRLGISEDAAFRMLQKASMDHNRRLLDVAEMALTLPEMVGLRSSQP